MALYGMRRHTAGCGDIREVDDVPVAQRGDVQEFREHGQVAHEAFRGHFLLEVVRYIGFEQASRTRTGVNAREVAAAEQPRQVELLAELGSGQAVELVADGTATEEIGDSPFDLASTRSTQRELEAAMFDGDEDASNDSTKWQTLLPVAKLKMDQQHYFDDALEKIGPVSHVRMSIYPDGGVSRIRLFGRVHG